MSAWHSVIPPRRYRSKIAPERLHAQAESLVQWSHPRAQEIREAREDDTVVADFDDWSARR